MISARDVDNIYKVPLVFRAEGMDDLILDHFRIEADAARPGRVGGAGASRADAAPSARSRSRWSASTSQLEDAYKSVVEALTPRRLGSTASTSRSSSVDSEDLERGTTLEGADGILIPGGFGERGIEGKVQAARIAREQGIPFLGICLGMQIAVVEFARHVCGMDGANSAEFDPETPFPVVDLLPEQKEVSDLGGTMRLGADPVKLHEGTRAREIFGEAVIYKRHRHRYEVNNQLRRRLEDEGLVIGGTSPDERLVEIVELPADSTRSSSPPSSTPSSTRARHGPSRCSASSSAPRRSGRSSGAPRPRRPTASRRSSARPTRPSRRASAASPNPPHPNSLSRVSDDQRLLDRFMRLCEIPSPTGSERAVADAVIAELRELGFEVIEDDKAEAAEAAAGNLIARLPGSGDGWIMFCGHLDTVPEEGAIEVELADGVFRSAGETILGADNKAAVAVLIELAARHAVRSAAGRDRAAASRSPRRTGCAAPRTSTSNRCARKPASCSTTRPRSAR